MRPPPRNARLAQGRPEMDRASHGVPHRRLLRGSTRLTRSFPAAAAFPCGLLSDISRTEQRSASALKSISPYTSNTAPLLFLDRPPQCRVPVVNTEVKRPARRQAFPPGVGPVH